MTDASDQPPRNWSTTFLLVIIAIIIIVGGTVMLGLPGAVLAFAAGPPVEWMRGLQPGLFTDGDRAWGVAMLLTITAPPGMPVSHWISTKIWPVLNVWLRVLVVAVGTWIWSVAVVLWLSVQ